MPNGFSKKWVCRRSEREMDNHVLVAFAFTLIAGLSTGIGSALAFLADRTNTKFLAASLGFSAGVMIYVSFVELLAKAVADLGRELDSVAKGNWAGIMAFFGGMALIAIIDKLVPEVENPHEAHRIEEMHPDRANDAEAVRRDAENLARQAGREHASGEGVVFVNRQQLMRTGTLTALVIGIHNFPEGLATFMSTLNDPGIGFSIMVAIAIHNSPEGIAVSVPLFYATGNRRKAFTWSFLSGLTEPLGALVGYLVLRPFLSVTLEALVLAGVAGIMVFISLDELLPSAERYGEHHLSIYGAVGGMFMMAMSLLLLT